MTKDNDVLLANKAVVRRFNIEVIQNGNEAVFHELMASDFVNHTAAPGSDSGPAGMLHTFTRVLRPALPDLRIDIHDQLAEGAKVTTRKTLRGTHLGNFLGIAPTNRAVAIDVIDIVTIRDGRYAEHWGINTLASVLAQLAK